MLSKLTLIGLHNYTKGAIWNDMDLPSGIDVELLINEILKKSGEFPLIYPDPDFLKIQIKMWCKKWYHNFERWQKAYEFEYEALYNLDVTYVIEEHGKNSDLESKHSAGLRNGSGNGSSDGSNSSSDTKSEAAYDSATFQPVGKNDGSGSTSLTTSESHTESDSRDESIIGNSSHDITTTETRRGNQGITMSQELLLAELNAWKWNLYDHIADVFISEFCICIYA